MLSTNIDLQPVLSGKRVALRPLTQDDYESLYQVANDPLIWEQHPSPLRHQRDVFDAQIFSTGLASQTTLVALDKKTSQMIGSSRYYDVDKTNREIAIGFTFLARSHWGGATNQEMKSLMLTHAFTWAKRVWFHVACNNIRSCKALEKIGAKLSHTASRAVNGQPVDHRFFYIDC
jgi:RimJ/RimL family protein N-acetyltransferase